MFMVACDHGRHCLIKLTTTIHWLYICQFYF